MTIPARYTLTEAHFKIAELEADAERLREERDAAHRELRDFQHVEGESLVETAAVAASSFGHAMRRAETAEAEVERLRSDKDERDWRTLEIVTKQAEAAEAKNAKLSALIVEQEAEYGKLEKGYLEALATVREALAAKDQEIERLRAEVDAYGDRGDFLVYRHEWDELNELVRRLRKQLSRAHDDEAIERERAEAAEAEVERLTEELREISGEASKGIRAENRLP